METVHIICAAFFIVFTHIAFYFINKLWLKPKRLENFLRKHGFQGNPYRSIHGDLSEITRLTRSALSKPISSLSHDIVPRIMPFVHETIQQYGLKSFIWYGRRPRINVTKPEHIREIFTKYEVYHKECPTGSGTFGLVMREGQNWVKIRRILNPAFHVEKLKNMVPIMQLSCETMLKKWEEMVAEKGSSEIDVWSSLSSMSADVIARAAFGTSYEEGKRLFKLQDQHVIITFQVLRSVTNYIPGWRYIPTKMNRKMIKVEREIREIVKNLIGKRKESLKKGKYEYKDDLLGIMLESNEKEIEEHGSGMTMDDIIEECKLFHLAGEDTTAALLTWTMLLLSQYQDWQTKAREEVFNHFGKDKSPDFESINHLKIVAMIINETLRFYPPVTSLSRMIHQSTKLDKLPLLKGKEFSLPTILVHRDPDLWGSDANEFNPGRFAQGVSNAAKVPGSFFPFGGGPRVCIGQNFALVEAKLVLAKILQRFSFQLSPSYVHAPRCLVSLEPQFGTPLILHKI